jgi:hypothetical protein
VGEIKNQLFCLSFDLCLKVDFQGSRITSDGGTLSAPDATIGCGSQTVREARDVDSCTVCEHAQ